MKKKLCYLLMFIFICSITTGCSDTNSTSENKASSITVKTFDLKKIQNILNTDENSDLIKNKSSLSLTVKYKDDAAFSKEKDEVLKYLLKFYANLYSYGTRGSVSGDYINRYDGIITWIDPDLNLLEISFERDSDSKPVMRIKLEENYLKKAVGIVLDNNPYNFEVSMEDNAELKNGTYKIRLAYPKGVGEESLANYKVGSEVTLLYSATSKESKIIDNTATELYNIDVKSIIQRTP